MKTSPKITSPHPISSIAVSSTSVMMPSVAHALNKLAQDTDSFGSSSSSDYGDSNTKMALKPPALKSQATIVELTTEMQQKAWQGKADTIFKPFSTNMAKFADTTSGISNIPNKMSRLESLE